MVRNKQIRKKVSQTLPNAERGEEDEIDWEKNEEDVEEEKREEEE